jgi:hypothetical protein
MGREYNYGHNEKRPETVTEGEHRLIVQMFIQQTRVISALTAVLESQGIIQQNDLDAYDTLISADETRVSELELEIKEAYQGFAKLLGVNVGPLGAV